jgi:hypothetical protein
MDLDNLIDPQSLEACSQTKISVLQQAVQQNILGEDQPLALFYDLTRFKYEI